MAEEIKKDVIINFEVKSQEDAKKAIELLNKEVQRLNDELEETKKQSQDAGKATEQASKKGLSSFNKGLKAIGASLKALGIGLLISLVASLTTVLGRNQKIVDAFNKVMETISITISQVVTAIQDAVDSASQATGGFDALGKVLKGIVTLALTPLKVSFFTLKLAVEQAQLAWEKSVFGDGDQNRIKELNDDIAETKKTLVEIGIDAVNSGKDIVNNFGEAITEVGELGSATINELKEVSVSSAIEQANALVELRKQAEINQALVEKSIFQYQLEAERLRQVRDDETKTIQERIEANEKLGEVLRKQQEEELKLAQQVLQQARAEVEAGDTTTEAKVRIINAEKELLDIKERIAGFESEQQLNRNALNREQEEALKELNKINKDAFELQRIEAQQLYEERKRLIDLNVTDTLERNRLLAEAEKELTNNLTAIQNEQLAEQQRIADAEKQIKDKQIKQSEDEKKAEEDRLKNSVGALAEAVGLGKEFAIAQALFNTYQGVSEVLTNKTVLPEPFGTINKIASIGTVLATGLKSVSDIRSVNVPGGGGTGGQSAGGGQGAPPSPNFNLVGTSNTSAITETENIGSDSVVNAVVVSRTVTSAQQADRLAEEQSTF